MTLTSKYSISLFVQKYSNENFTIRMFSNFGEKREPTIVFILHNQASYFKKTSCLTQHLTTVAEPIRPTVYSLLLRKGVSPVQVQVIYAAVSAEESVLLSSNYKEANPLGEERWWQVWQPANPPATSLCNIPLPSQFCKSNH